MDRTPPSVHRLRGPLLSAAVLQDLLGLRARVFVVEQASPWLDVDGRDLEPGTLHLFSTGDDGAVTACVRITDLPDPDTGSGSDSGTAAEPRVGRVVAAPSARGTGVIDALLRRAVFEIGDRPSVLDAQTPLVGMYARYGYRPCGPEYVEDGIEHTPMRRDRPGGGYV